MAERVPGGAQLSLATPTASPWQPIAEYGLLADCNSAALVSRDGSIDWLCLPRYDSPSLLARILDPAAGHWHIRPVQPYQCERRYLPGTLVIETTFTTPAGVARLTDAMAFGPGQRVHDLGLESPHEVLRLVEAVSGSVEMTMELALRPDYGRAQAVLREIGPRRFAWGPDGVAVGCGVLVAIDDATIRSSFVVHGGDRVGFAMRWAGDEGSAPVTSPERVASGIAETVTSWQSWEEAHDVYTGAYRDAVRLGARILKGLAYRPTGAIVAAPTTSLPEAPGGERNWDYRYSWVRDASLTLEALYIGACSQEAAEFVSFLARASGGHVHDESALQIMYGVGGERELTEQQLPHLGGWRDSRPVRIGNGAWNQTQLDVYGEFLSALYLYRLQLGELPLDIQHFAVDLADSAARKWMERDAGMWEMRGEYQHHLSSKVLCWTALDRAVRLAPHLGADAHPEAWATERDKIRAAILERGWSERRQAYAQAFDSDELDAAALLMPLVGFLPATDPRMRATIEAIARDLAEDGLVLRYRAHEGLNDDGLTGREGTFVICSFWLASCLARAGEIERAEALWERLAGHANDLGLLAEEIDSTTGELLGNFPQAFSHIGLITAAWEIERARGTGTPPPPWWQFWNRRHPVAFRLASRQAGRS